MKPRDPESKVQWSLRLRRPYLSAKCYHIPNEDGCYESDHQKMAELISQMLWTLKVPSTWIAAQVLFDSLGDGDNGDVSKDALPLHKAVIDYLNLFDEHGSRKKLDDA